MTDIRVSVVQAIEACLRDGMISLQTLASLDRSDLPPDLNDVVHALHHFQADADVRSRDAEYAAYWRIRLIAMRELVRALD